MAYRDFSADVENGTLIETVSRSFLLGSRPAGAILPGHDAVADPEAGWAARNPARALAFLYVTPRDCAALDELLAA